MAQWFSPKHTPASADVLFFTDIQRGAVEKRKKIVFGLTHTRSVCFRKCPRAVLCPPLLCTIPSEAFLDSRKIEVSFQVESLNPSKIPEKKYDHRNL